MPNTRYTVKLVGTDEVLADGLLETELAEWWKKNEDTYFGLRVEGTDVIVDRHTSVTDSDLKTDCD